MKLSTQTILVLGIIQCIILTLLLVFFFRYQAMERGIEPKPAAVMNQ